MARKPQLDLCLICGSAPCTCNKVRARPKKAAPKSEKPVDSPQETASMPPVADAKPQSFITRMRDMAAQGSLPNLVKPEPVRARPTAKSAELPPLDAEDSAMLGAIRLLSEAFVIKPEDLARWQPYLDKPASTTERAALWRTRRGEQSEGKKT